jgi:dephospho-CoA kinase
MAEKVVDQLREENVRAHLQVERLSKRNRSSEKDAKKALSALRKWGRVS